MITLSELNQLKLAGFSSSDGSSINKGGYRKLHNHGDVSYKSSRELYLDQGIDIGFKFGSFKSLCPKCTPYRKNKSDKSLSVNTYNGTWNCHNCGWGGSVNFLKRERGFFQRKSVIVGYKFTIKQEKKERQSKMNEEENIAIDSVNYSESTDNAENKEKTKFSTFQEKMKEMKGIPYQITESTAEYREFIESRGFFDSFFQIYGVSMGNGVRVSDGSNEKIPIIKFPYIYKNEIVNCKYREIREKKFKLHKGSRLIFFNLDSLRDQKECIITEGEFDALAYALIGAPAPISVPNGASGSTGNINSKNDNKSNLSLRNSSEDDRYSTKFQYLEHAEAELQKMDKIIISVDNDIPGRILETELARRLAAMVGIEKLYITKFPEGIKDANECLLKLGGEALAQIYFKAEPIPIEGYVTVTDLSENIDLRYQEGIKKGASTGWRALDGKFFFNTGRLMAVTGIPSMGKSTFMFSMLVNIAKATDWHFTICSPEMRPPSRIIIELMKRYTGKPFYEGSEPRMTRDEMEDARKWVDEHFGIIAPRNNPSPQEVLELTKLFVARKGTKAVLIDPYNQLVHNLDNNQGNEGQYITRMLADQCNFSDKYDCSVINIAHPTKLQKYGENKYPIPTLWDISGSAAWRSMADIGLVVHREMMGEYSDIACIYMQKIRFEEDGDIGVSYLRFNKSNGRFSDLTEYELRSYLQAKSRKAEENRSKNKANLIEIDSDTGIIDEVLDNPPNTPGGNNFVGGSPSDGGQRAFNLTMSPQQLPLTELKTGASAAEMFNGPNIEL